MPFHLLRSNDELSVGDPGSGNLLVQGDNLLALNSLFIMPEGKDFSAIQDKVRAALK